MSYSQRHIDLSEYPEPHTDEFYLLPEELQDLLDNCLLFTEEATAVPPGKAVVSRLLCEVELKKYYECGGKIDLKRRKYSGEIEWKCRNCGTEGIITGYEGCNWDLSDIPEQYAQQYLFDKYDEGMEEIPVLEGLPFDIKDPEQNEELFNWLDNLDDGDKEKMIKLIEERFRELDRRFEEANGGLNPLQLHYLLAYDWDSPQNPIVLRDDLPFDEIEQTFFYHNARAFLLGLLAEKEFELTPSGNLKRKYIPPLLDEGIWPDNYVKTLHTYNKVLNESDVWLLHIIRVLLELSGLIRKQQNKLKPVQKHIHLTEKEHAGALYKLLFKTYFRKMNVSYMPNYEELLLFQEGIPFILYRLNQLADDWLSSVDVMRKSLMEISRLELLRSLRFDFEKPEDKLYELVLRPLELFGLIESDYTESKQLSVRPDRSRKNGLFNRFIQFDF